MQDFGMKAIATNSKKPLCMSVHRGFFFGSQVTNEVIMSKFYVDVQFKKQGCFSVEVLANDKQEATQKALNLARNCGYDGTVKKTTAKEV